MKISTIKSIWWHLTLVPVIALGLLLIFILAETVRDQWPEPEAPAHIVTYEDYVWETCKEKSENPYIDYGTPKSMLIQQCYDMYMNNGVR